MLSSFFAKLSIATLLVATLAPTQSPAPAKHAFEIISIRPDKQGVRGMSWARTPDGYRVIGQSLWSTIMLAYFPQGTNYWSNALQGGPSWLGDAYDIDARVSSADMAEWQKQGTALNQEPIFREMLQSMLTDRCKLAFHRIPRTLEGYALVIAKRGPKLVPSKPNAPLPPGVKLDDGGVAVGYGRGELPKWEFHSATLADLVRTMNVSSPVHPLVDRTGIAGHFDFILRCNESDIDHPDRACSSFANPEALTLWDWNSLGLRLVPVKLATDTLVIDHIEKPSEN